MEQAQRMAMALYDYLLGNTALQTHLSLGLATILYGTRLGLLSYRNQFIEEDRYKRLRAMSVYYAALTVVLVWWMAPVTFPLLARVMPGDAVQTVYLNVGNWIRANHFIGSIVLGGATVIMAVHGMLWLGVRLNEAAWRQARPGKSFGYTPLGWSAPFRGIGVIYPVHKRYILWSGILLSLPLGSPLLLAYTLVGIMEALFNSKHFVWRRVYRSPENAREAAARLAARAKDAQMKR